MRSIIGILIRRQGRRLDRTSLTKYWFVAPAVFVLLLVGLFPTIYALVASLQNLTMETQDYSWHGFGWYKTLLEDERF
jgi:multiple sugar transport system permease protein